jgi:hypothetical protein
MNKVIGAKVPAWFRLLAVLGLAWNGYGVYMYLLNVGAIKGAQAAPAQAMPAWVIGAFAIAVFAGLVGSLLMVMGSRRACPLLVLSFLAVIAQMIWVAFISNARAVEGMKALIMPGAITLVASLLMLVAAKGAAKYWLD